ncbi:MAG: hypothetical protein ACRDEA_00295, partial [Microcystaceae cyanobacterium]
MQNKIPKVNLVAAILIGFLGYSIPVNSLTIQTGTQEAFVFGKNNRVTQVSDQILIDAFFFKSSFETESNKLLIPESQAKSTDIIQSITQETFISGKKNRITQISQQVLIDSLYLEIKSETDVGKILSYKYD